MEKLNVVQCMTYFEKHTSCKDTVEAMHIEPKEGLIVLLISDEPENGLSIYLHQK